MPKNSADERLPRHLLVMRSSAMGDVAMLPHALRALKEAYPELKVTVATLPLFRPFFGGLDVDFFDVDTQRTHRTLRSMFALARQIRRMGVDGVADVHDGVAHEEFPHRPASGRDEDRAYK